MATEKQGLEKLAEQQKQYSLDIKMIKEAYAEDIGDSNKKTLNELVKARLTDIAKRSTALLDAMEKGYDITAHTEEFLQQYAEQINEAIEEYNIKQRTVENVAWVVALKLKDKRQNQDKESVS